MPSSVPGGAPRPYAHPYHPAYPHQHPHQHQHQHQHPYPHQNQHPHQHHHQQHQHQHQQHQPTSLHGFRPSGGAMLTSSASTQQPTYRGHIKTTRDAILLLSACDLPSEAGSRRNGGVMPPRRVTRRLLDSERADLICSGSIFVWDEKEAGMRRWTDGKCWSASRVSGCFLTYRELEARKKPSSSITGGPTSNLYKADGLIKQSFSMTTTSGRKLHAISYYTKRDVREGLLRRVSEDPRFVGEGGGEWDLQVDEHEYPDPISRAGELPDAAGGQEPGSQSPPSLVGLQEGNEPESSLVDERELADGSLPISPRSQAPPGQRHLPSPASQRRSPRFVESYGNPWSGAIGVRKEMSNDAPSHARSRGSNPQYPQDATPLHEARGLLPIHPIPVHSRISELPVKVLGGRTMDQSFRPRSPSHAAVYDEKVPDVYAPTAMAAWPSKGGTKRTYAEHAVLLEAEAVDAKAQRPRLQRMRSSSLTGRNAIGSGSGDDSYASIRTLAHVGSDEEGVSQMRSTHVRSAAPPTALVKGTREQASAVGALLSLRSSASDDSSKGGMPALGSMMNPSPATTPPTPSDSNDTVPTKPLLSRSDRAALDRFSIRI
uniref:cAMP-independent regulatory protein pac2-like protein n=1 Tax=Thecaphora frezii TaxID=1269715 RepID=A0A8T9MZK9_9BASI|nr:cAMP-independent regulatory protein pac2-like protein [Thecaphora frezii]